MRVLGIDPGSVVCGYGIVESRGNRLLLVEYGVIKAKKKSEKLPDRIKEIFLRMQEVIKRARPEQATFETIFYSKNAQSLIKLSQARAAAILAAGMEGLEISEYSPREIKKSVTGNGNASKGQVQFMVKTMLNITETPEFFDSTDALAAAICHIQRNRSFAQNGRNWKEFIKNNPHRIIGK